MAKLPEELQSIRGMNDIMPPQSDKWVAMEKLIINLANIYGFSLIRTPVLEPTPLFTRAIGEATDIVEKEMYSFNDSLNGQALTLRPENTASCIRAYYERGFSRSGLQRWFYLGPMYRHERPQKGRYRQFYQFGLEIIGTANASADCELIVFSSNLWKKLNIPMPTLEINTLGVASERKKYREKLIEYWISHKDKLDEESLARIPKNPMRLLDSKNPDLQKIIANAPLFIDELGEESKNIFNQLLQTLDALNIPYKINPRLVRGLDYYNHIVFEWVTDKLGAQATICGGGRYDGLANYLVGEELPACGFAIGLERLFSLIPEDSQLFTKQKPCIYIAHEGATCAIWAMQVAEKIREFENINTQFSFAGNKISNQIKKAVECGCEFVAIIGEREVSTKTVTIKNLKTQSQESYDFVNIADFYKIL